MRTIKTTMLLLVMLLSFSSCSSDDNENVVTVLSGNENPFGISVTNLGGVILIDSEEKQIEAITKVSYFYNDPGSDVRKVKTIPDSAYVTEIVTEQDGHIAFITFTQGIDFEGNGTENTLIIDLKIK